jgi:hypothetical protein
MLRAFVVIATLFLLTTSNSFAGFSSYNSYDTSGSIVASVEIENKGIYNLITSIQFLRKPQDRKIFGTDEYEYLINQLSVEARGVILQEILQAKTIKVTDFAALKSSIENEIRNLIANTKKKHGVSAGTEVIFSLGNFYLLETKD